MSSPPLKEIAGIAPEITTETLEGAIQTKTPNEANNAMHTGWLLLTHRAAYLATRAVGDDTGPVIDVHQMPLDNLRIYYPEPPRPMAVLFFIPDEHLSEFGEGAPPLSLIGLMARHDPGNSRTIQFSPETIETLADIYMRAVTGG